MVGWILGKQAWRTRLSGRRGYDQNEGARPFLCKTLDAFGTERIMWASDVTVNPTGETWAELLFAIKDNPGLSAEEREYVLGRSARNWLNWEV